MLLVRWPDLPNPMRGDPSVARNDYSTDFFRMSHRKRNRLDAAEAEAEADEITAEEWASHSTQERQFTFLAKRGGGGCGPVSRSGSRRTQPLLRSPFSFKKILADQVSPGGALSRPLQGNSDW